MSIPNTSQHSNRNLRILLSYDGTRYVGWQRQAAGVRVNFGLVTTAILRALNALLPHDIRVTVVEEAGPAFHARFDARGKRYRYQIANVPVASPFTRAYACHLPERLHRDAMRDAAGGFVGAPGL